MRPEYAAPGGDGQAGLAPIGVSITGGERASYEAGSWRVPKGLLVAQLQVLLQAGRLQVARGLPDAAVLVEELQNFQVRVTAAGHEQFASWREGSHDDLVLATALAAWAAEHMPRSPFEGMGMAVFAHGKVKGWGY